MQILSKLFQHDQINLSHVTQGDVAAERKGISIASTIMDSAIDVPSFLKMLEGLEDTLRNASDPKTDMVTEIPSDADDSAEAEETFSFGHVGSDVDNQFQWAIDTEADALFAWAEKTSLARVSVVPEAPKKSDTAIEKIYPDEASIVKGMPKDKLTEMVIVESRLVKGAVGMSSSSTITAPSISLVAENPNTEQSTKHNLSVIDRQEINKSINIASFQDALPTPSKPNDNGHVDKENANVFDRVEREPAVRNETVNEPVKTDLLNLTSNRSIIKPESISAPLAAGLTATKRWDDITNGPSRGAATINSNAIAADSLSAKVQQQQNETPFNSGSGEKGHAKPLVVQSVTTGTDAEIKKVVHNTTRENPQQMEVHSEQDDIRSKSGKLYHQSESYDSLARAQERSGNKSSGLGEFSQTGKEALLTNVDSKPSDKQNLAGRGIGQMGQPAELSHETAKLDRVDRPQIFNQIVKSAALHLKDGRSEMRIDLKPEILGRVRMLVATDNQQITLRIFTEYHGVKDIIDNSIGQLKSDLQNQGLAVDKLEVSVSSDAKQFDQRPGYADRSASSDQGKGNDQGNNRPADEEKDPTEKTIAKNGREDGIDFFA